HPALVVDPPVAGRLRVRGDGFPGLELAVDERLELSLEPCSYGTRFGAPEAAVAIVARGRFQLPLLLSCRAGWPVRAGDSSA
ncbi:MAG TPA: hypothetical protein VJ947_02890, partial [Pseudohaliea sp.]|nr:hypothetical protein [Pseudohaliea sp.]